MPNLRSLVKPRPIAWRALVAIAGVTATIAIGRPSEAAPVERVVAVVGDQPVLLTELRQRAKPYLVKIYASVPPAQQKIAEGDMFKELLGKLVDERVVAAAADKLNVQVTTREVDEALKAKALELRVGVGELVAQAASQGLTELEYREEVRRELLFGKMLETRVRSRVRPTEDDAREYFKRLQVQERRPQNFRAALVALDLPSAPEKRMEVRRLADEIVKQARAGTDFSLLAKRHSVDASRDKGGDLGIRAPNGFGKAIDEALLRLDAGQVSEPLLAGSQIFIVKVLERAPSSLPPYDDVKDVVMARVRDEMMQKQIKVWLDELKAGVYIDIRL
jgi:peptidyl-prolyl cis-trans isomerase SurA